MQFYLHWPLNVKNLKSRGSALSKGKSEVIPVTDSEGVELSL
jgi:hypothetical protein